MLEVPLPLGKLLFEADHGTLEAVMDFLIGQGWGEDYELIFSGETLLEMTVRGANKGGMIRRLAARLHISMEHVYCVGDEANDLSMLKAAAEGFAPPTVRAPCGKAAPPSWRMPGRELWQTWWPGWKKNTADCPSPGLGRPGRPAEAVFRGTDPMNPSDKQGSARPGDASGRAENFFKRLLTNGKSVLLY